MPVEEALTDLKERVKERLPPNINITELEFEGPEVVIYTDDPRAFADNGEIVKKLARELRKRIVVRPDPRVLADPETSIKDISEIVPEEAGITNHYFDLDTGEIVIEAKKPGLVIGRHGATLREITKKVGWTPRVVRTPPIESVTVKEIRQYLRSYSDERKELLKTLGKKIHREVTSKDHWIRVTTLGGCREVGRTCFLLSTPESKILVDCGVNVGSEDSATPYLYAPEVSPLDQIDAVVVTHAHLDHAGLVPLLFKYGYDGPIYCTPPTRDLMSLLQLDYIDVAAREGRKIPYDSAKIREVIKHTLSNGGKVLIRAFAVGRSQEVMIVLEEGIRRHIIDEIPVYLDGMIWEATAIHTTYPEYLNSDLRNMIFHEGMNPFLSDSFVRVEQKMRDDIIKGEPCVILATPGMLNSGPVMEYLKALGPQENNTLVFVGYQAEGTLGRRIQKGWKEIPVSNNGKTATMQINLNVETVDGFSGHSDRQQLIEYVKRLNPRPEKIVTSHGEESKCTDLASTIYKKFKIETRSPMNLETVRFI